MASSTVAIGTRFRTGQVNPVSGHFRFDGYLDGTSWPSPSPAERHIPLSLGERFPPVGGKGCYWVLVQKL
jgi:hypothetical protein